MCLESLLQAVRRSVAVHLFICKVYRKHVLISSVGSKFNLASEHGEEENGGISYQDDPSSQQNSRNGNDRSSLIASQSSLIEKSGEILTSSAELAQKSICQLLLMRKESTAKLPLHQMKFMWETSLHFILTVDKFNQNLLLSSQDTSQGANQPDLTSVVNLSTFPLRNGLLNQTKKFIEYLHESFKGKLVNTLDNEKW
jgi:hypothetical protein